MTEHDEHSFAAEVLIPVDLGEVLADEALRGMPDGPAKRFLARLASEMRYDGPPPQIVMRRA